MFRQFLIGGISAAVVVGLLPSMAVASVAEGDSTPPVPPASAGLTPATAGDRAPHGKGYLKVRIRGLDNSAVGRVRVVGDRVNKVLRADSQLRLPAGTYEVTGLPTGSFEASGRVQKVRVWPQTVARTTVKYRQVRLKVKVNRLSMAAAGRPGVGLYLKRGDKVISRFSGSKSFYGLRKGVYRVRALKVPGYSITPSAHRVVVYPSAANRFEIAKFRVRRVGPEPVPSPTPTPTPTPTPPPIGDWNPRDVPPLPVAPEGSGAKPPVYQDSVVTGDQGLAVSLRPTLFADKAPSGEQYQFSILPLSSNKPLWQGSAGTNRVKLPAGVIANGATYRWQAKNVSSDVVYGPFIVQVDTIRSGIQPVKTLSDFQLSLASGELQAGVGLGLTPSPSGDLGMSLGFLYGQPDQEGMPQGWTLASLAQPWSHIAMQEGGSIALVNPIGTSISYMVAPDSGGNLYTPAVPNGWRQFTGQAPSIVRNDDGTWTVTALTGDTGVFDAPDAKGLSYLRQYSSTTSVSPEATYVEGRLRAVSDPVTGTAVRAFYQGDRECPEIQQGFITPPQGMLCSVVQGSGLSAIFQYLQTDAGQPVLARVVKNPHTVDSKPSVTDFGYDQAGRIISQRNALAVDAIAAGLRDNDDSLLSQVSYDGSGRVATAKAPAAQPDDPRMRQVVRYSTGVTVVDSPDVAPTSGYLGRVTYEPATMNVVATTNGLGQTNTIDWDDGADQVSAVTAFTGLRQTWQYDDSGLLIEQAGPWHKSQSVTDATPKTTLAYDREVSGSREKPMTGFNVTYWSNAQLLDLPTAHAHGPVVDGNMPMRTQWTWPASPTGGGTNPWGVRMTGALKTEAAGVYHFKVSSSASVWIGTLLCKNTCAAPMVKGLTPIRIDLQVTNPGPDGAASISVEWDESGSMKPIDMDNIFPAYANLSVASTRDALSAQKMQESVTYTQFDDPWTGLQTSGWNRDYPEAKGGVEYEGFDPGSDQLSRLKKYTMPTGNTIRSEYWGADEKATAPCQGMREEFQGGLPKSFTRALDPSAGADNSKALTYATYYDRFGQAAAGTLEGVEGAFCTYRNDVGDVIKTTIPAVGDSPATTSLIETYVDRDPFRGRGRTTIGDTTYTNEVTTDLLGRPVRTTDVWGTTQEFTYHPFSGNTLRITTTTSSGYSTTTSYLYNNDDLLMKVDVDGETIASIVRTGDLDGKVVYANGVELTAKLTNNGQFGGMEWVDTDGKRFRYDTVTSPTGRLLTENLAFGGDTAEYQYTYDPMGRLVHAHLDSTLPVTQSDWKYEFSTQNPLGTQANAGLNANRTRLTVDNVRVIDYGYDAQDRLIQTTDPSIGNNIEYNRSGQMTMIGDLSAEYNGQGQPFRVTDGSSGDSVTYWRTSQGMIAKTKATGSAISNIRYTAGGIVMDDRNRPMVRFMELPGGAVVTRDISGAGGGDSYSHVTIRGQAMWTSDADGRSIPEFNLYEPYGTQIVDRSKAVGNPYEPDFSWMAGAGIPSDTLDETSLIPMGARLYLPGIGRFTSPDPLAYGSANQYDYACADPINQADPSGTDSDGMGFAGRLTLMILGATAIVLGSKVGNERIKKLEWDVWKKAVLAGAWDAGLTAGINLGVYAWGSGGSVGVVAKAYIYITTSAALLWGLYSQKGTSVVKDMASQVTQVVSSGMESAGSAGQRVINEVGAQVTNAVEATSAKVDAAITALGTETTKVVKAVESVPTNMYNRYAPNASTVWGLTAGGCAVVGGLMVAPVATMGVLAVGASAVAGYKYKGENLGQCPPA